MLKSLKTNTLEKGLIERTISMLHKISSKTMDKEEEGNPHRKEK